MFSRFGFGRKKAKREGAEPDRVAVSVADFGFGQSELFEFISHALGNGHYFGTLYAIMQGFEGRMPVDDLEKYLTLLEGEPRFSEVGVSRARMELFEILNSLSRIGDDRWYASDDNAIGGVARCIAQNGADHVFQSIGLDVAEYLKDETERLRRVDLRLVWHALREKRGQLTPIFRSALSRGRNKYGDLDYGPLAREIHDYGNYAFPEGTLKFFYIGPPIHFMSLIVNDWLLVSALSVEPPTEGLAFEHWCAERLREQGWIVSVSQASGDQGVDIVAAKSGKVVAVQCKRYVKPVSNKAVQEVFSGMQHYGATAACVIASGGFTRSAFELAKSTGVRLLDYQMINDFSMIYGAHDKDMLGESDESKYFYLFFVTSAEKTMGRLFRTVAIAHAEQARLYPTTRTKILTLIEDNGAGELGCSRMELAGLVTFSALVLNGCLSVSEVNRGKLVESGFPNSKPVSDLPVGYEMRMYELLGPELLLEVQGLIRAWSIAAEFETEAIDAILSV